MEKKGLKNSAFSRKRKGESRGAAEIGKSAKVQSRQGWEEKFFKMIAKVISERNGERKGRERGDLQNGKIKRD